MDCDRAGKEISWETVSDVQEEDDGGWPRMLAAEIERNGWLKDRFGRRVNRIW